MGEYFFWYRTTLVVPDQRPLNGCVCVCAESILAIVLHLHARSSINPCIFRVVQVIQSLQHPLEVGNNLPGINDSVRERGLEQKCF